MVVQSTTNQRYKTIQTKNVNEATFYILYGGIFGNVRSRMLPLKKASKRGYVDEWTLTINNVPQWALDTWRTYQAYGNITSFVDVRNKLKKQIKRELGTIHKNNQKTN